MSNDYAFTKRRGVRILPLVQVEMIHADLKVRRAEHDFLSQKNRRRA